jgi:thiol-disulfide isomerase/thioredoxin
MKRLAPVLSVGLLAVGLLAVAVLVACDAPASPPAAAPVQTVGPSCLSTAPTPSPQPTTTVAAGGRLPDAVLRCFAGGEPARLSQVAGPAIINLWASWCPPCQIELPAFQRYAERAGSRVNLVGVITADEDRDKLRRTVERFKLTFPMVEDPEQKVLAGVGKQNLPVTLFVAADGRIAHVYNAQALDESAIAQYAKQYLGVVVL